jgi:hypothetical protein
MPKRTDDSAKPLPRYKDPREQKRFYLLPGQGGRAYHRKQMIFLKTSLAVGLIVSGLFALIMYLIYRSPK